MNESNPELKAALDDVWLEEAKTRIRDRMVKNLQLIEQGYFSEEELSFALTVEEMPEVIVDDEEVREIIESGDAEAWNRYIALNPQVEAHDAWLMTTI